MGTQETVDRWTKEIAAKLEGRTIKRVRYLTGKEMDTLAWDRRAVVLELDDGNILFPSADDEGNDAGAIFTSFEDLEIIPVI